jgi:hypothetical protein
MNDGVVFLHMISSSEGVSKERKQTITIYYVHTRRFRYTSYSLLPNLTKNAVCTLPLESTFLSLCLLRTRPLCGEKDGCVCEKPCQTLAMDITDIYICSNAAEWYQKHNRIWRGWKKLHQWK